MEEDITTIHPATPDQIREAVQRGLDALVERAYSGPHGETILSRYLLHDPAIRRSSIDHVITDAFRFLGEDNLFAVELEVRKRAVDLLLFELPAQVAGAELIPPEPLSNEAREAILRHARPRVRQLADQWSRRETSEDENNRLLLDISLVVHLTVSEAGIPCSILDVIDLVEAAYSTARSKLVETF